MNFWYYFSEKGIYIEIILKLDRQLFSCSYVMTNLAHHKLKTFQCAFHLLHMPLTNLVDFCH